MFRNQELVQSLHCLSHVVAEALHTCLAGVAGQEGMMGHMLHLGRGCPYLSALPHHLSLSPQRSLLDSPRSPKDASTASLRSAASEASSSHCLQLPVTGSRFTRLGAPLKWVTTVWLTSLEYIMGLGAHSRVAIGWRRRERQRHFASFMSNFKASHASSKGWCPGLWTNLLWKKATDSPWSFVQL